MFFYVYVLKLKNGDYYIGSTENIQRRLKEHNQGLVDSTKPSLPYKLVSFTGFLDKRKALLYEKYLKKGSGFAFRNKHLV